MPGEDTNELMKLRAVQGELEDLPEDNPRATLSSRIRSLLLRLTGVPQLVHLYGTLSLNKTLTLDAGEDECASLFLDGTYLYAGLWTSPAKIVKIDLSDFTKVSTLPLNVGENNARTLSSDGTYLYVGTWTSPAKIVRIRLSDFTRIDAITLGGLETYCSSLFIDGTFLYAGLWGYSAIFETAGKVVKIDLDSFTTISTLTFSAVNKEFSCASLTSDGSYLYAGLAPWAVTANAKIGKINLQDFSISSVLTLGTGETECRALSCDGSYIYAGLSTIPAKVSKISVTAFEKIDTLTLNAGENHCHSLLFDGGFLYAGLRDSPAKITKIDIADFTRVSSINSSAADEDCYFILTDCTYIYAGLYTTPAKIVRRYIMPSNATLRERKTDQIHQRNVEQSMPMLFYGKVTTYTDATHFKCSTLSGFGDDFFANNKWYVFVARDAAGGSAAPDGELQPISDYTSSDGTFNHTAFTAPLAVGDEILVVHKAVAAAIAGGGGVDTGGISIWDSFEYPSDLSLNAKWSGTSVTLTRSLTAFYEHYSMQVVVAGAGGEVHRNFAVPQDIGALRNISVSARCNNAGETFQFTLCDSSGNCSFWTQTLTLVNTWYTFDIDPHSLPSGVVGAPVDLDDVVQIQFAALANTRTYLFDLIILESLMSSIIGLGYDGFSDNVGTTSSVRGHLFDTQKDIRVQGIELYDDFNDNSKDADIWDTDTIVGSTTISETSGVTRFANDGLGTAGYSDRPTVDSFGKSLIIEADITLTIGTGTSNEAYIELYQDAGNYFQFGLYRSAATDSRGRITYNIAGAGEVTTDVDITDTDAVSRNYRIIVDEHNVHVYLERQLLATIEFEQLNNYIVRMEAGTTGAGDTLEVDFNNFHIFSYWEQDQETYRRIESIQGGSESIQTLWNQLNNLLDLGRSGDSASNFHLDMTEQTLWEITAQDTPFQHIQSNIDLYNMGVNDIVMIRKYQKAKSGGTYRLCEPILTYNNLQSEPLKEIGIFTNQFGAKITIEQTQNNGIEGAASYAAGPVWVNETAVANSAAANDMNLLPVGGDAVDDAYYFGGDRPFGKIVLVLGTAGARATTDWTIVYEYWDGALWSDVSNISDGTTMFRHAPGTLNITFDIPDDWAVTNAAGSLPFNIYWFRMRVSVAGTGAFTQPLGTRSYIYLTVDTETMDALR